MKKMTDQESIEYSEEKIQKKENSDSPARENEKNEPFEEGKTSQRSEEGSEPREEERMGNPRQDSRLARLRRQREVIEARIQSAEARFKTKQKKQETRRKILVGSYYLDKAIKENNYEGLKLLMRDYLTRESDKKLFE